MKLSSILVVVSFLVALVACGPRKMDVEDVIAHADTAVVEVRGFQANNRSMLGAGFIINAKGLIVTNYHVIRDAERIEVTLSNGQTYPVLGIVDYNYNDAGYPDFAILKIDASTDLPGLPLGDDKKLKPGETVVTIGNPIAYAHTPSVGNFAQHRQLDSVAYLQITAPISHGNSGGPLLNLYGEVVGINTLGDERGQNLNFALSVQYIKEALDKQGSSVRYTVSDVLALQKKRDAEQFEKLFTTYEHPQKLFSMLYPRGWKTFQNDRWRYGVDPDTSYVQTCVFAPDGAYNAETGYLAGGIRVIFYRPSSGRVWNGILNRWPVAFKRRTLDANNGFAFTDSSVINLDQIPTRLYTAIGRNENISEIELDRFLVSAQPNYLLSIELACPNSQSQIYDTYYRAILQSFRFGLDRGTLP
ncbi:trypsin-like serine protease [Spirosoma sp. HMF4905]|uniref:Trypsin-like serine protease n=1 Tax=Spirosoma arboris TaxID=2682092 RepID=A0A7K1SL15_9BACT|nr:S1C family serine protease [Spirosoma arboris]MVM34497.1 trypsin-like serine protease [Spirosoma arboris]